MQETYDKYIELIKDLNSKSSYFSLSGGGKTKLKRILKYKLGYITELDLYLYESGKKFLNSIIV